MLKSLGLKNFRVFPDARLTFGGNLNIVDGENGSGKTPLVVNISNSADRVPWTVS